MKEYIVTTLPIEVKDELKLGTLTAVEYVFLIAKKTSCNSMLYLNGLNSYREINIDMTKLRKQLEYYGIEIDNMILDLELLNENLCVLEKMIQMKMVVQKRKKIYRCKCGRVEMPDEAVRRHTVKKIVYDNDGMHCKICNTVCECYEQDVLIFKVKNDSQVKVIPNNAYLNNFRQFDEQYRDSEIMISRARETGVVFNGYNIDVDFFWSLFVGAFSESGVVIVSSNTHLFKLYLINQIGICFDKDIIFVIHPRIVRKQGEHISSEINKYDELYRNMILLYSPKWKTQKCFYNVGMMKYLAKIRGEGRKKLYDFLCEKFEKKDYYKELMNWIEDEINLQDNIIEVIK